MTSFCSVSPFPRSTSHSERNSPGKLTLTLSAYVCEYILHTDTDTDTDSDSDTDTQKNGLTNM